MLSNRYSCQILMKLEFSRQIFEKYSNIKLHENQSGRSRVFLYGRTDRHIDRQTWRSWWLPFVILPTRQKHSFNIIILSTCMLSKWSLFFRFSHQNPLSVSHFTHPYYISRPSHPPSFYHPRKHRLWISLLYIYIYIYAHISKFVLIAPN